MVVFWVLWPNDLAVCLAFGDKSFSVLLASQHSWLFSCDEINQICQLFSQQTGLEVSRWNWLHGSGGFLPPCNAALSVIGYTCVWQVKTSAVKECCSSWFPSTFLLVCCDLRTSGLCHFTADLLFRHFWGARLHFGTVHPVEKPCCLNQSFAHQ